VSDDPQEENYIRESELVCAALERAGFPSRDFGRFRGRELPSELGPPPKFDHAGAVPVLLDLLPRVTHHIVKEIVVRHLSTKYARGVAVDALLREFHAAPAEPSGLKWAIGNALDVVTTRKHVDLLLPLVLDVRHGVGRQMVVSRLGRLSGDERIVDALRTLSEDPDVCLHAMGGLRRLLDPSDAVAAIEALMQHPDEGVRRAAKRELTKARRKLGR
jgi:hypothetical protein